MKTIKTIIVLIAILTGLQATAQRIGDLSGINYQAVAIDEEGKEIVGMDIKGKPLYEKQIGVRFTILKGQDGEIQYQETHTALTDQYGLFSLTIGKGTQTGSGTYTDLLSMPWIDADQWLKVEISIKNDGNYRVVSLQQLMTVPYSFYTDDIADDAITTEKILKEAILNEDVSTGAVDSRTILDETILAEDIATGAVTTSELLDETILAEDIATGAVTTSELLNETILADDIATGAVTSSEILDSTIINKDIAPGAVDSRAILNESILAEDISTGAVTSSEILDSTIQNEDIADGTINLSTKVTDTLAVEHGGTGAPFLEDGGILIGGGSGAIKALPRGEDGQIPVGVSSSDPVMKVLAAGTGIKVTQKADSVVVSSTISGEVEATGVKTIDIGIIASGSTYTSPAFPVPGESGGQMGDIILASIDVNLQGCMLTPYFFSSETVKIAIFNGTGTAVNLGNGVNVKILIVK